MKNEQKQTGLLSFYCGKRVLITGHTGFKGTWLSKILTDAGAEVTGFALEAPTEPNLFTLSGVCSNLRSVTGDIRDFAHLGAVFEETKPEIVIHLAAQPLVRLSYEEPLMTYQTNVMGTVHVCECVRHSPSVKSFLNVTTDKVYENREWEWGYRENEPLDGYDPYSNSKSCSELVTHSYIRSYFQEAGIGVSTARAGNVIGGGDFAQDRIIPDCVRAACGSKKIHVRNPFAVRPYQHVLEPLFAYLLICRKQYEDSNMAGFYNIGPDEADCITTGQLAEMFCNCWGEGLEWENTSDSGPHEANYLKLDCARMKSRFSWHPVWSIAKAIEKTVEWSKVWRTTPGQIPTCMTSQIDEYAGEIQLVTDR